MSLELNTVKESNHAEIQLSGRPLSEDQFEILYSETEALHAQGVKNLILNLEGVQILNSLGVKALIKTFTKCRNIGGDMVIVNISEKISQVLVLTKLNTVLNIAPSLEEAKNQF